MSTNGEHVQTPTTNGRTVAQQWNSCLTR